MNITGPVCTFRRFLLVTRLLAFVIVWQSSLLLKAHSPAKVKKIQGLAQSLAQGVSNTLGVYIGEPNQVPILAQSEEQLLLPASVTKLVTGMAVLDKLGPNHRIKTKIYSDGTAIDSEGRLPGSLYLVGGGDPSFVSENMWVLVNHLLRSGLKEVQGAIVVDDSLFDAVQFDPSRLKNRVDRAYDAPVGAMSFNWNSVNIYVRPGTKVGESAQVILDPLNAFTQLQAKVVTQGKGTSLSVTRTEGKDRNKILVSGTIGAGESEKVQYASVTQPAIWSGYHLLEFLKQRGIRVRGLTHPPSPNFNQVPTTPSSSESERLGVEALSGLVQKGTLPPVHQLLAESESKPLAQMVADMNKFSNNYVAEMLTKLIATERPATLSSGMEQIQKFVNQQGIKPAQLSFENPSGLSKKNRVTAKALWLLLHQALGNMKWGAEHLSSLPLAGADGTLRHRLKGENQQYLVRAKTGYIDGVTSLAGYYSYQGRMIPFVFLYNGVKDPAHVRNIFDEILSTLVTP